MAILPNPPLSPLDESDPDDYRPNSAWTGPLVESGEVELRLGGETRVVTGQSVVFVPAGVEHSAHNVGSEPARYLAFFPTTAIDIEYLERNPVPGTEGDPPQPPFVHDAREPWTSELRASLAAKRPFRGLGAIGIR